jgi:MarR family transcriptional regulator, negative regulator of the multidrug operon emrRAB
MSKMRTANLVGALAGAIGDRLQQRQKAHPNETDSSLVALNLLSGFEGCSNVELSQAMKLSHPATVRLLDKLEAAGWVERGPGEDRRSVSLSLTTAGRKRVRQIARERGIALAKIVDRLSEQQRRNLDDIAQTLLRSMTTSELEAAYICRLCDDGACPPETCPVHQAAIEIASETADLSAHRGNRH